MQESLKWNQKRENEGALGYVFGDAFEHARTRTELGWIVQTQTALHCDEESAARLALAPAALDALRVKLDDIATRLIRGLPIADGDLDIFGNPPFTPATREAFLRTVRELDERRAGYLAAYDVPETIPVKDGIVTTMHSIPVPGSDRHVILCPGSFTGPKNFQYAAAGLACEGMSAYGIEVNTPEQAFHEGTDYSSVIEAAYSESVKAGIRAVCERNGKRPVDLVGFSTGAAAVVNAALDEPDRVAKVVLLNPIGVASIDKGTVSRMIEILGGSLRHGKELTERGMLDPGQHPLYGVFADWVPRQLGRKLKFGELIQIFQTAVTANIVPKIAELRKRGVEVMIVATEDDALMPLDEVRRSLLANGLEDVLLELKGLHTAVGHDPEGIADWIGTWLGQTLDGTADADRRGASVRVEGEDGGGLAPYGASERPIT